MGLDRNSAALMVGMAAMGAGCEVGYYHGSGEGENNLTDPYEACESTPVDLDVQQSLADMAASTKELLDLSKCDVVPGMQLVGEDGNTIDPKAPFAEGGWIYDGALVCDPKHSGDSQKIVSCGEEIHPNGDVVCDIYQVDGSRGAEFSVTKTARAEIDNTFGSWEKHVEVGPVDGVGTYSVDVDASGNLSFNWSGRSETPSVVTNCPEAIQFGAGEDLDETENMVLEAADLVKEITAKY